ncbi:hypothetical protein FIV39_10705 [Pseudomonas grimontii]|uniref:Uncharacterized protein n=1 Tax=Pseudomonas grimontii TaxID=129847 RepID=A0A5C5PKB0_9PSED|nr:hypothetical protein FIV39_10705 [Pseudomonas grimontii]
MRIAAQHGRLFPPSLPTCETPVLAPSFVWMPGAPAFSCSLEPQWTVACKDDGWPQFTLFAGINVTFGK